MGRKKYFCDYCDKSFNDDPKARALHLKSFRHIQLKEEHYKHFKDPASVLEEELAKGPCLQLANMGHCKFGGNCKFSHKTPFEIAYLKEQVDASREFSHCPPPASGLEHWRQNFTLSSDLLKQERMSYKPSIPVSSLPPSLQPFCLTDFVAADLTNWGD